MLEESHLGLVPSSAILSNARVMVARGIKILIEPIANLVRRPCIAYCRALHA
ncbi:hypothetical protein ACVWXO_000926 [Bradyrhizobium sp. LM2.7]